MIDVDREGVTIVTDPEEPGRVLRIAPDVPHLARDAQIAAFLQTDAAGVPIANRREALARRPLARLGRFASRLIGREG